MFARTTVQSRWWRLFAILALALAGPILLRAGSTTEWLRSAAGALALIGLTGYAFGFRVGPQLFWRIFAILFSIGLMLRLGAQAGPALRSFGGVPPDGAHKPVTIALGFLLLAGVCVALFRHSGLVPAPDGPDEPEPLFPSRARQWEQVARRTAEAQAELERPMSAAMKAEAESFGPMRQLTLKQKQRIGTVLLIGAFAAQIALTLLYGGLKAILIPAVALAIGSAVATYFSAEAILKAQAKIAGAWKAVAILLLATLVSYLVGDSASPKLWLARTGLSDVLALLMGTWLVVSAEILKRRR